MGWIFDIAVVVLVIIAAVIGAKKGFFRACFDFCGALIAMVAAGLLSSPVAEWIFTTFFRPSLVEKISAAVMGLGAGEAVNTVFDAFPELIQRALEAAGITQGSIMAQVQDKTDSIAEAITDALSPMLINVIGVFVMLVLFVLFIVVLRGVATLLTGISRCRFKRHQRVARRSIRCADARAHFVGRPRVYAGICAHAERSAAGKGAGV